MAMTKKEKAAFDAALHEARVLGALRWTDDYPADVPPPGRDSSHGTLSTGFYVHTWDMNYRVSEACSSSVNHGIGSTTQTSAQRPIHLYSSRLRALKSMRYRVARNAAKALAKIDAEIAAEQGKES